MLDINLTYTETSGKNLIKSLMMFIKKLLPKENYSLMTVLLDMKPSNSMMFLFLPALPLKEERGVYGLHGNSI
ncbi:hypothetical protein [Providencia stuartii]|uniref:hypothetical protein n=1 Tax=Providencia stuartii TaxID=588 RepID=UPI002542E759|nr:hypothetical protein [Providencia thailandensis]WIJ75373.1 hypothetical protein OI982_07890 [Providencia thailandensis]